MSSRPRKAKDEAIHRVKQQAEGEREEEEEEEEVADPHVKKGKVEKHRADGEVADPHVKKGKVEKHRADGEVADPPVKKGKVEKHRPEKEVAQPTIRLNFKYERPEVLSDPIESLTNFFYDRGQEVYDREQVNIYEERPEHKRAISIYEGYVESCYNTVDSIVRHLTIKNIFQPGEQSFAEFNINTPSFINNDSYNINILTYGKNLPYILRYIQFLLINVEYILC